MRASCPAARLKPPRRGKRIPCRPEHPILVSPDGRLLRHPSFGLFSLRCLTSPSVEASSLIAPLRPAGSLRPFGLGIPARAALSSAITAGAFAFSGILYPLRRLLPCGRNTVASQRRDEWGLPCLSNMERRMGRLRPIVRRVTCCHRRRGFQSTIRPACPFGPGLSAPLAGFGSRTLTMDVHLRSAFHPLLGRLRIGASRLWPLSPKLHTADCSFACPGSSTWVDKVPSRDTPSLNLAGCQGGVHPDDPQVTRNQSKIDARLPAGRSPASARTLSPPSVSTVTGWILRQPLAPQHRAEPALRCGILAADEAEVAAVVAILGHRFADDDLEVPLLVVPVPEVAAIDPDNDCLRGIGDAWPAAGPSSTKPGCSLPRSASCRAATLCRWRRMVSALVGAADRQDVLQQGGGHAEGDQRGPAGLQIEQLRGDVLGEQLGSAG